jgi:hypothetical protein
MPGGHGLSYRRADQCVHARNRLERPRSPAGGLDPEGDQICRPDAGGRQRQPEEGIALPEDADDGGEEDPDEARVADDGEPDEDRVEPRRAMLDDPEENVLVYAYARISCFVDSISCWGSKGLPKNA